MKLIDRDHTRNSKPAATHYRLPQKARSVMTQYAPFAGMSGFGSNFTCVHLLQARRQKLCVLLLSLSLSLEGRRERSCARHSAPHSSASVSVERHG